MLSAKTSGTLKMKREFLLKCLKDRRKCLEWFLEAKKRHGIQHIGILRNVRGLLYAGEVQVNPGEGKT